MEARAKIFVVLLVLVAHYSAAATISGTAFEWHTLEPLAEVIIEINTVPKQVIVAEDGSYSLNVGKGNYTLRAQYFEANRLKYEASEEITVKEEGSFNLDLIMLPVLDDDTTLLDDFNQAVGVTLDDTTEKQNGDLGKVAAGLVLLIVAIALFFLVAGRVTKKVTGLETERIGVGEKAQRVSEAVDNAVSKEVGRISGKERDVRQGNEKPEKGIDWKQGEQKLGKDLGEIISLLGDYGGRMTQKEIREKTNLGEAKLSLMVAELENMGKIKKFKQGRGNIIVLKEKSGETK